MEHLYIVAGDVSRLLVESLYNIVEINVPQKIESLLLI